MTVAYANPSLQAVCVTSVGLGLLVGGGAVAAEQSPATAGTVQIEEIIVTAQKRQESVREVPASISVMSEDQLTDLHATQLTDFAAYVPGLQVTSSGSPGSTAITLRGIAPLSSSATIGTYVDETPLGSSGLYQAAASLMLDLLPYDIARVEVLRGPQGTLYGAGAMGGLLKYVTRDPDLSALELRLGGGVSDVENAGDLGRNVRVGVNLPLISERLALRASYARNELPGFIDNAVDGRKDINDATQESARAALQWQASDAISLKLTVMQQTIDSDNLAQVAVDPTTRRALAGDLVNTVFIDEPFRRDIDLYAATLEWDLGWADFTSASGYSELATEGRQDYTFRLGQFPTALGLPAGLAAYDFKTELEKFTQEFRLTSKSDGAYQWQLGTFYTKEEGDNPQVLSVMQLDGSAYPALPSPPFPLANVSPLLDVALPSDFEELAIFANASYKFTELFELGAGIRYSQNDQHFAQVTGYGALSVLGLALAQGRSPGQSDEGVFTWSLSPKFHLSDDVMLYGRVATGYQPGGPNIAYANVPPSVDASTLTSYEVGVKSELSDRRMLLDVSAYRIDWDDIQVITSVGVVNAIVNAAKAVSQGVELTTAFQATDRLRLGLNAAYADASLSNDLPAVGGFSAGLEDDGLPFIPEFSWSATADYFFPLGAAWSGHVGAGYRWVDDRPTGLTNTNPAMFPAPRLDSYGALDLNADISSERWTLRLYSKNLTDERAYLNMTAAQNTVTGATPALKASPIQPRAWGIEVDYTF